ncbi:thiamine pyrophosphate-binding protein [bacterium]
MTASDIILKHLQAQQVDYIFGIPGINIAPLYEACEKNQNIKAIIPKHELGAICMADGYARVKKSLGVCLTASESSAMHLIPGLANAFCEGTPLLLLTGEGSKSQDEKKIPYLSQKCIDASGIFSQITKSSFKIISENKINDKLRDAVRIALCGKPGPVHINIPLDIMSSDMKIEPRPYKFDKINKYFDRRMVVEAAKQIVDAKNPMILVGSGVITSGACHNILDLAETLSIPVASSPKAKGAFPEDHALSLGVLGICGSPLAEKYMKTENIDLLLAVGTSLDEFTTMSWDNNVMPAKKLIHINLDPMEIDKNYVSDIAIIGDAHTVIEEISIRVLREISQISKTRENRTNKIEALRRKVGMYLEPEKLISKSIPVKPQSLMKNLQDVFSDNSILFADAGNSLYWAIHYLQFKKPGLFMSSLGMPVSGYGLAASIGAKLAAPDQTVISLVGDGAFQMSGMEIATAVNYDIPVIWIVQNNSKLGFIQDFHKVSGASFEINTKSKEIDIAKIAKGFGAQSYRINKPNELKKVLPEAIASSKPTVIDCIIDPDEVPPFLL